MAEQYDQTTPTVKPDLANWKVVYSERRYAPPSASYYQYNLVANDGQTMILYRITDSPTNANLATTRLKQFNTMNFSTQSEHRRVLTFASTDINPATGQPFLPAGSVSGTPDV